MGFNLDDLKGMQKNLHLVARTGALSPTEVTTFLLPLVTAGIEGVASTLVVGVVSGVGEAIGGRIIDWIKDSIQSKHTEKREKNERVLSLFGYCRNADFFVGKKQRGMPTINDLYAASDIIQLCTGTFGKEPEHKRERESQGIDFKRNLICIGGINQNPATSYILDYIALPYKFSPHNNILTLKSNKTTFIPESYPGNIYAKDYSTVIQVAHPAQGPGESGGKILIVSGTTASGTRGAALALRERNEILDEIWAETRGRDFQAILSIDMESIYSKSIERELITPVNMNLLEINRL